MKFMEIDEGGYVHHICDDPEITMIPLTNRVSHGNKEGKSLVDGEGRKLSYHKYRWELPMAISDEDFQKLTKDGLCGVTEKGAKWHYKYDKITRIFSKSTVF